MWVTLLHPRLFQMESPLTTPQPFYMGSPSSTPSFVRWNHPSPPPAFLHEVTLLHPRPFQMGSSSSTLPPPPPFQITSLSFTSPPAFSFSLTRTKTVSCIACTLLLNLKFTFKFLPSSSPATNKVADQRMEPNLQSSVSESDRLMIEACPFSQFKREHPLEQWTVGSLPNLTLSWKSQGKRYSKLIKM